MKYLSKWIYALFIEKTKMYNRLTKAEVEKHVENLRKLDEAGKLEFCGVFKGYPGVVGLLLFKTNSYEEAEELCKQEPLVAGGYAKYKLKTLQVADKENNYLLGN